MNKKHFFLFEENGHSYGIGVPSPHVSRGPYKTVVKYLSRKKLSNLVGGYVLWGPTQEPDARMPEGAIGVYGNREVQKFRQALRDAGANFTAVQDPGPLQILSEVFNAKTMASIYPILNGEIFRQRFVYGRRSKLKMSLRRYGPLEFSLPEDWISEPEDGLMAYYRKGDKDSTLRVSVISAVKKNSIVSSKEIAQFYMNKKKEQPNSKLEFVNGRPILYEEKVFMETGVECKLLTWEVSDFIEPNFLRAVTFTYTIRRQDEHKSKTKLNIGMLWDSVKFLKIGASVIDK